MRSSSFSRPHHVKESTPQALVARKTRDRLAFLALPPAEAQRRISLAPADLARDLDPVEVDLSYGLGPRFPWDENLDA